MLEPVIVEESIDVAPSADNGNVPVDAPETTPSEPVEPITPETPAEPVETVTPTEPELFELPDGRKVDAATVAQEYKNLLSDYTRKSQELAKAKPELPEQKPTNPYADPSYVPQTYEEILQEAEARALRAIEAKSQAQVDSQKALEDAVSSQLDDIRTTDPQVNENALFLHATKYGFRDLKQAHQNMKDMSEMAKKVQTVTAQNIAKRTDPVSVSPGATGAKLDPSQFATAREYVRALKGQ